MMECPECGATFPDGDRHCTEDGARLVDAPGGDPAHPSTNLGIGPPADGSAPTAFGVGPSRNTPPPTTLGAPQATPIPPPRIAPGPAGMAAAVTVPDDEDAPTGLYEAAHAGGVDVDLSATGSKATAGKPLGETDARQTRPETERPLVTEDDDTVADPLIGTHVGNYRFETQLGQGGMGTVYRARQPRIGKVVAIKVLNPGLSRNREAVRRFFNEAKAVNAIRNEHILDIVDFDNTVDGRSCMIMELLEGETLQEALDAGPMPEARALFVAAQVCDALHAAHARRIIHRDLKPENVFLIARSGTVDFVKVVDFGVAKLKNPQVHSGFQTRAGVILGTPIYMAPEQCEGKEVTPASDIYALGVMLFCMVVGHPPFEAETVGGMMRAHLLQPPPDPRAIRPGIDAETSAVILRCLEKSPEARLPDMRQLQEQILRILTRLGGWHAPVGDLQSQYPAGVTPSSQSFPSVGDSAGLPPRAGVARRSTSSIGTGESLGPETAALASGFKRSRLWLIASAASALVLGAGITFYVAGREDGVDDHGSGAEVDEDSDDNDNKDDNDGDDGKVPTVPAVPAVHDADRDGGEDGEGDDAADTGALTTTPATAAKLSTAKPRPGTAKKPRTSAPKTSAPTPRPVTATSAPATARPRTAKSKTGDIKIRKPRDPFAE